MMKKFLALALVFTMLMSSLCFAAELPKNPTSCEFSGEMTLAIDATGSGVDDSMNAMLAFVKDVKITYKGSYLQKSDLEIKASFDFEILAGMMYLPIKCWIDMDFTKGNDMVYKIILELPETLTALMSASGVGNNEQYLVIDYAELFNELPGMSTFFDEMMDYSLDISEKAESMVAELLADIKADRVSKNHHRIKMTDKQMKEFIIDAVDAFMELYVELLKDESFLDLVNAIAVMQGEDIEIVTEDLDELYQMLDTVKGELDNVYTIIRGVKLLSEDSVFEYKTNDKGFLSYAKSKMNMVFDVDDWIKNIAAVYPDLVGSMVDPTEKVGIVVTVDINDEMTYKKINSVSRINFPTLTKDNSFNMMSELKDDLLGLGF